MANERELLGNSVWHVYVDAKTVAQLPLSFACLTNEDKAYAANCTLITDYVNEMVRKFIIGSEALNEDTFAAFVAQMIALASNRIRILHRRCSNGIWHGK